MKNPAADNEVAVAVAVRCGAEVRRVRPHHQVEQVLGVDEVRVGVVAAEIGQRRAVAHGARGRAQFALEDRMCVRPGDGVHRIEGKAQAAGERCAQGVEIEQLAHQLNVIRDRIDHLHLHAANLEAGHAAPGPHRACRREQDFHAIFRLSA